MLRIYRLAFNTDAIQQEALNLSVEGFLLRCRRMDGLLLRCRRTPVAGRIRLGY